MFSIEQIERRQIDPKEYKEIGTVKLENVSFGYGGKLVFENINLDLKIPDTIGIRGDNNAGKATLMRLIAGILKPTDGRIFINGIPPSDYHSEELVKYIGYISSNNVIFQGTILENLTAFDETMEHGFQGKYFFTNEYILNGNLYQTRTTDKDERSIYFPLSKKILKEL
ncbi:MAG: ATP-binding cassette domain-containing protein, partial [Alphaproteobacteria bacterium]|nr:ATP-binding cassette domain-containing protein [Alphaproteobacteria bacterium]